MESDIESILSSVKSDEAPKSMFVYDSGDTAALTARHSYLSNLIEMMNDEDILKDTF